MNKTFINQNICLEFFFLLFFLHIMAIVICFCCFFAVNNSENETESDIGNKSKSSPFTNFFNFFICLLLPQCIQYLAVHPQLLGKINREIVDTARYTSLAMLGHTWHQLFQVVCFCFFLCKLQTCYVVFVFR